MDIAEAVGDIIGDLLGGLFKGCSGKAIAWTLFFLAIIAIAILIIYKMNNPG